MAKVNRRTFLTNSARAGLGLGAALGLGACDALGGGQGTSDKASTVHWWMNSQPDLELNKKLVADHAAELGAPIDIRYITNAQYGQSLQLAKQSNQLPDISVNAGLNLPISQLIANDWFQPLNLGDEATGFLNQFPLYEGLHKFDGKIYTFPIRDSVYNTIPWFHTDLLSQAGLDPSKPPATYDEFRAACKAIKAKFDKKPAGLLLALKLPGRNASQVDTLAQAAGFEGFQGKLFKTGEFAYHTDPYVHAIEFQKSLFADGYTSGGVTVAVKQGQARWAAKEAVFYWDGPWIPGNVRRSYPSLKGHYGVGPMLVPNSSQEPTCYLGPPAGFYYIPQGAKHPKVANKILNLLATPEYYARQIEITGNPPPLSTVLKIAHIDAVVATSIANIEKTKFVAPVPILGNKDVAVVDAEIKPVEPSLGAIIQGYFSDDIKDLRGALKKLSDASAKALEKAISAAKDKGAKVSMDDYVFPNWQPRADYTTEMYPK